MNEYRPRRDFDECLGHVGHGVWHDSKPSAQISDGVLPSSDVEGVRLRKIGPTAVSRRVAFMPLTNRRGLARSRGQGSKRNRESALMGVSSA